MMSEMSPLSPIPFSGNETGHDGHMGYRATVQGVSVCCSFCHACSCIESCAVFLFGGDGRVFSSFDRDVCVAISAAGGLHARLLRPSYLAECSSTTLHLYLYLCRPFRLHHHHHLLLLDCLGRRHLLADYHHQVLQGNRSYSDPTSA